MDLRPNLTLKKSCSKSTVGRYRGVWKRNGKWVSEIRVPGSNEKIWLSSHNSAEKAARAYDAATYCIRGEEGKFNFPNNIRPQLTDRQIGSLSPGEIKRIAREFSSVGSSDGPAVKPSSMLLSTMPPLLLDKPAVQDQLDTTEVAAPEVKSESVFPTNSSEMEPYVPAFEPEEAPVLYESLPFDEAFIKDSDNWILDFMAEPSYKCTRK